MVLKRKKFEPLKKDFEYILKNLTVNGKVPSVQELSDKFANGTATIKDGIIARLYSEGALFKVVDDKTGRFKKEFYETRFPDIADEIITFLDNFQSSQGASKAKGLGKGTTVGASGLVRSTNKIISEIKKEFADDPKYKNNYLDLPISVFEEKASDIKSPINMNAWNPTKNVIDKQFKQGKLYIRPKSSTAGTRIFRGDVDAKKVLNAILTNVAGIKNTEVKIATITALFGQRLEALIDMAKTAELAMEGGPTEYDPFYDSASKKITSPTDITGIKKEAGRKYLPPTVKTGPLLSSVLDFMSELDPDSGDIFPTLTRSQMETNLKNVVFSGIENEIALMLGRPLSGYTDLRRVFASTVINEMADQLDDETLKIKYRKAADELLGHETVDALEKGIGTVMEEHYAKVQKQKGKLVVDNVFYSFERFLAETLGAANAKGELSVKTLASRLGLNTDTLKNLDFIYSQDTNKKAIAKGESPEDKKKNNTIKRNVAQGADISTAITNEEGLANLRKLRDQKDKDIRARMEKTGESYEEAEKFYSPDKPGPKKIKTKVKGKLNTESPLIKEIMTDNNLTEADVQDMTAKDFFDRYDSMKPEGQEFRADDIDTPRVRSYGATLEATAPNFLDFVTDPETLKKAGKVGLELAGGFPKKIFKAGKIAIEVGKKIKPDIKDPAERFDILESVPEEEEKETTEERTRGQINNLFDSPLGP